MIMKLAHTFVMTVVLSLPATSGLSASESVIVLLNRAKPLDAETYGAGLRSLATEDDTVGMLQYLLVAFWEREPFLSSNLPPSTTVSVMRTKTKADAEAIFQLGLMFAAVGVKGHGNWDADRKVAEFGVQRILMMFGDVLVAIEGFGQLTDYEKTFLINDLEKGVLAWRTQKSDIIVPDSAKDLGTRSAVAPTASQNENLKDSSSFRQDAGELEPPSIRRRNLTLWAALFTVCVVFFWLTLRKCMSRSR